MDGSYPRGQRAASGAAGRAPGGNLASVRHDTLITGPDGNLWFGDFGPVSSIGSSNYFGILVP